VGSFIGGIVLTLVISVPIVVLLLRQQRRRDGAPRLDDSDIDTELSRLTGELAHEIKNPLSTVKVNLTLMKEALEDIDLTEAQRGHLDTCQQALARALRKVGIMRKETDRLEQIVDGFLQYVRQPELQLATVDLNELVGDMIDFYWPQASSHSLTLRHTLAAKPLMCRVDAGALKQTLLNLFINAQQACEDGGELMVRTSRQGDRVVLQVSDTGRGIALEDLPKIFRPYYSSRSGGTGLGLPTAKKMVEAHGGTIEVHSEPGRGTSFTIELPLAGSGSVTHEVSQ